MKQEFKIRAYWGSRRETIERCADRLQRFYEELNRCAPSLTKWRDLGRPKKGAEIRYVDMSSKEALLKLLHKGRNRRDIGGSVIEELGFRVILWNRFPESDDIGLSIKCGSYPTAKGAVGPKPNNVLLDLPSEIVESEGFEVTANVLAAVAKAWEPDWAGVTLRQLAKTSEFSVQRPFVDWMVYVPSVINQVPKPSSLIKLDNLGTIIIVQPSPPVGDNPEEAANKSRIVEPLNRRKP